MANSYNFNAERDYFLALKGYMLNAKTPMWFYLAKGPQGNNLLRGPVYLEEIIKQISEGTINGNTQVRLGQTAYWKPAASSDILKPYLDKQKKPKFNPKKIGMVLLFAFFLGCIISVVKYVAALDNKTSQTTASLPMPLAIKKPIYIEATKDGIIRETNKIRQSNGLEPLIENPLLNQIARERIEDMFKYQYVAHVSPTGVKYTTIAQRIGYHYKRLSENIGSIGGNATDIEFLNGWMQSPGHKSAILDNEVKEIGVAVKKEYFKHSSTTISVQIFGLSAQSVDSR